MSGLVRNIVLLISDTLRRDHLRAYADTPVRTPHLDRLAERCLVFDRAYSGSFPTVPCRNDILTGRYTFAYTLSGSDQPSRTVDLTVPAPAPRR